MAVQNVQECLMHYLVDFVIPSIKNFHQRNENGMTPLHWHVGIKMKALSFA